MQARDRYTNGTRAVMAHEPDPEVLPKAERRQFSAEYKLRVLAEADRCSEAGQNGALLRREGLYSSHLSKWRQQREQGATRIIIMPAWPCSHRQTSTMVEPPRSWRSGRSSCSRRTLRIRNVSCKASRSRRHCRMRFGSTSRLRQHPWRNLMSHLYSQLPTQRIEQRWRATRALLSVNGVALGRAENPAQTHTSPATLFQKAINSWVVYGERSDCSATSPSTLCMLPNLWSQVVSKL